MKLITDQPVTSKTFKFFFVKLYIVMSCRAEKKKSSRFAVKGLKIFSWSQWHGFANCSCFKMQGQTSNKTNKQEKLTYWILKRALLLIQIPFWNDLQIQRLFFLKIFCPGRDFFAHVLVSQVLRDLEIHVGKWSLALQCQLEIWGHGKTPESVHSATNCYF